MEQPKEHSEPRNRSEKRKAIDGLVKAVMVAYSQGLSRKEVQALCGAAYGDWYEENEDRLLRKYEGSPTNVSSHCASKSRLEKGGQRTLGMK